MPIRQIRTIARLRLDVSMLIACISLLAAGLHAQTKPTAEQVQAAYLYNFAKFIKWPAVAPANQNGSFTICVIDQDPFGAVLESRLVSETIAGKPVVVKRLSEPGDSGACHILFIGAGEKKNLREILAALNDGSVLTVSDMPEFTKHGGMIQFVLDGDRVRFEVNLGSTEKSHLILASELLKVAAAVKKSAPGD